VDAGELRVLTATEVVELGPEPARPRDFETWRAERHGAAVLLAAAAEWDESLLRRAALSRAGGRTNHEVAELLLDASNECG